MDAAAKPARRSSEQRAWVLGRVRAYLAAGGHPSRDAFITAERPGGATNTDLHDCGGWASLCQRAQVERAQAQSERMQALPLSLDRAPEPRTPPLPTRPVDFTHLDFDDDERTHHDVEPLIERTERRVYVVTYAQNATPIDDDFFASLLAYCEHRSARLVVLPGRYRNPTSIWNQHNESDEWWDERLAPYLYLGRLRLADDLVAYGDISIQPTAVRPLTGFEVLAANGSAIFGHPKIQLRCIAAPKREDTRIFTTTGAVTSPNYTHSKAGKKGEAHHVSGAAVVEVDGDTWHVRQINADDEGAFIDLDTLYTPAGVEPAPRPLALVMGDVHVAQVDEAVIDGTLRRDDSIARALLPEQVLFHDLLDFRARNHHSIGNPDEMFARALGGVVDIVEDEVTQAIRFVDDETPEGCLPVVVASNHDEAFDRWLRTASPNTDPRNARFFHEMRARALAHYEAHGEWSSAFALAYADRGAGRARLLRRGESYDVGGVECSFHGDAGLNGSRGSALGYARLAAKVVIGHSHTPQIIDGVYQVGVTGRLDQGYNATPSSWMHAHCLVNANGKRTLIFVRPGGRWRAAA